MFDWFYENQGSIFLVSIVCTWVCILLLAWIVRDLNFQFNTLVSKSEKVEVKEQKEEVWEYG